MTNDMFLDENVCSGSEDGDWRKLADNTEMSVALKLLFCFVLLAGSLCRFDPIQLPPGVTALVVQSARRNIILDARRCLGLLHGSRCVISRYCWPETEAGCRALRIGGNAWLSSFRAGRNALATQRRGAPCCALRWVLGCLAWMCQTAELGAVFNSRIVHLKGRVQESHPLEIVCFAEKGYFPRPLARLIGGRTVLWLSLHMGRVAERMVMILSRAECEDNLCSPDGFENMGPVFSLCVNQGNAFDECITAAFDKEERRARTLRWGA